MRNAEGIFAQVGRFAWDVIAETLWPTRCCVCERPGEKVLCDECLSRLKYIDSCKACPLCGAPYGVLECSECNDVVLNLLGLERLPVDGMASVVELDDAARRIVTIYKDADERRLRDDIARLMSRYVSPDLIRRKCAIVYIPDTKAALRRRGFDHSHEIAKALAADVSLECLQLFKRPKSFDQRKLNARQRISNMTGTLALREETAVPENILLVDDVCTTGATLFSAASALKENGAKYVYGLTFGRVLS